MVNGAIGCVADTVQECLEKLAHEMKCASYIMIFYGSDVSAEEAEAAGKLLSGKLPDTEITVLSGGQPLYDYIISVE